MTFDSPRNNLAFEISKLTFDTNVTCGEGERKEECWEIEKRASKNERESQTLTGQGQ